MPPKQSIDSDPPVTITRAEYERLKQYELLNEVRSYVERDYLWEIDEQAMLDGAVNGMLAGLEDPYTFYYPAEVWKKFWEMHLPKPSKIKK